MVEILADAMTHRGEILLELATTKRLSSKRVHRLATDGYGEALGMAVMHWPKIKNNRSLADASGWDVTVGGGPSLTRRVGM